MTFQSNEVDRLIQELRKLQDDTRGAQDGRQGALAELSAAQLELEAQRDVTERLSMLTNEHDALKKEVSSSALWWREMKLEIKSSFFLFFYRQLALYCEYIVSAVSRVYYHFYSIKGPMRVPQCWFLSVVFNRNLKFIVSFSLIFVKIVTK